MTQITVVTDDNAVVVYDQYGNPTSVGPDSKHVFELTGEAFCTISNAPEGQQPGEAFLEKMRKFWKAFWDKMQDEVDEAREPVATPV